MQEIPNRQIVSNPERIRKTTTTGEGRTFQQVLAKGETPPGVVGGTKWQTKEHTIAREAPGEIEEGNPNSSKTTYGLDRQRPQQLLMLNLHCGP